MTGGVKDARRNRWMGSAPVRNCRGHIDRTDFDVFNLGKMKKICEKFLIGTTRLN